jgi:hypothetical protein
MPIAAPALFLQAHYKGNRPQNGGRNQQVLAPNAARVEDGIGGGSQQRAATRPASRPQIVRPNHQMPKTAVMFSSPTSPVASSGLSDRR